MADETITIVVKVEDSDDINSLFELLDQNEFEYDTIG